MPSLMSKHTMSHLDDLSILPLPKVLYIPLGLFHPAHPSGLTPEKAHFFSPQWFFPSLKAQKITYTQHSFSQMG